MCCLHSNSSLQLQRSPVVVTTGHILCTVLNDLATWHTVLHVHIDTPCWQLHWIKAADETIISCSQQNRIIILGCRGFGYPNLHFVGHYDYAGNKRERNKCVASVWQWGQPGPDQNLLLPCRVGCKCEGSFLGLVHHQHCFHPAEQLGWLWWLLYWWVLLFQLQYHCYLEVASHQAHLKARPAYEHEDCHDAATRNKTYKSLSS